MVLCGRVMGFRLHLVDLRVHGVYGNRDHGLIGCRVQGLMRLRLHRVQVYGV